jgi:hypothetical protein
MTKNASSELRNFREEETNWTPVKTDRVPSLRFATDKVKDRCSAA